MVIGVILREWLYGRSEYDKTLVYGYRHDLYDYLTDICGVTVIGITVRRTEDDEKEFERVRPAIDLCDGIIFPGGLRSMYIDMQACKYCYDKDIPTLGICNGFQVMNKVFNGNRIERIGNDSHLVKDEYVHKVVIDKNSLLYKILGEEEIMVNSRHRLYIKETPLDKVAYSKDDGILEAVEDKNKKFFVGVQWHPESLQNDIYSKKLFDYFLSKCK